MLDINKLYKQISALGTYQQNRSNDLAEALRVAEGQVQNVSGDPQAFRDKMERANASWLIAIPTDEAPFKPVAPGACPESHTILSTDGSQINPDRHSPHPALLINVGKVKIGYGDFLGYKMESEPSLFFEERDIKRRFGGEEREVSGQVLAALRQKMEHESLKAMIEECGQTPAVAVVDGTLILWNIEANPKRLKELGTADLKQQAFLSFMQLISVGKEVKVPVVGYISSPGSSDVVNSLKVSLCPSETVNCKECPYKAASCDGALPCDKIDGVTDAGLFRRLLGDGERSSLFISTSEILDAYKEYGDEGVAFFYINIGKEIARVEVPMWVARDKNAVGLVHAICLDQAVKGSGYPVAVAEAHEQAVVKSADKRSFDQLIFQIFVKNGIPAAESRKALRKKGGFI
ncbi:MAG: DNA double-strand break repair nuclease NurA [Candidatus Aquicultor sp.]